jgi:hypothetical protein
MIPSEQARLLLRKAAQDQAVLDLLENHGLPLPEQLQAVEALTPFGTVFRYNDLPLEGSPDHHGWPPLISALFLYVEGVIKAGDDSAAETSA